MSYHELSIEERATIQVAQLQGLSQRAIARMDSAAVLTVLLAFGSRLGKHSMTDL
jgi:hypothetical protein